MVMRDRVLSSGRVLRWLTPDGISAWRRQKIADLHNTEGRRVVVQDSASHDRSIEAVDSFIGETPAFEKKALNPRSGRETVELLTQVVANQMLHFQKYDPEAFRRRLRLLREQTGSQYAMWSDDQLAANVIEVCRRAVAEPTVQRVYEKMGRGGGYREVML